MHEPRLRSGLFACAAAAMSLCLAGTASAADYDESVSGDLSDDPLLTTTLPLDLGSNVITGSMANSNDVVNGDRDFFNFTVPVGQQLEGIFLLNLSPSNRGFHAINSGNQGIIPSGPGAGDPSNYLGSAHLDPTPPTTNLLPDLGTPLAGIGFSGPLGPGTYTYVVQQTSNITQDYSLDFVLTPEPASVSLVGLGVLATLRRRRA